MGISSFKTKSEFIFNEIEEAKKKFVPNGKFQYIRTDSHHWIVAPDGTHGEPWYWKFPARMSFEGKEYIAFGSWFTDEVVFPNGIVFEMKKVD